MITINSEQLGEICNGVWRDREAVLEGRGILSGEATLVRAVFWRSCKVGLNPKASADSDGSKPAMLAYQLVVGGMLAANGRPAFDGAPMLPRRAGNGVRCGTFAHKDFYERRRPGQQLRKFTDAGLARIPLGLHSRWFEPF